jgi:pyruvate dehydrogenase E2 component (dihydrolipoamide acetyltransferase)
MAEDKLLEKLSEDAHLIRLPKLGDSMDDATIVGIIVEVGSEIAKDDIIFEIETDKATVEMQSPFGGIVKAILVEQYDTLEVDAPLMIITDSDVDIDAGVIDSLKKISRTSLNNGGDQSVDETYPDLNIEDIVTAANDQSEIEYQLGRIYPASRMQKLTAQRMLKSKREIPCFYLNAKVDVTELAEFRDELNETREIKVSYNDLIIRAVALGLKRFKLMTGQPEDDNIRLADSIGIGLAIDTPGGLVAPVIKDADEKSVVQIAKESQALIAKAKSNKLQPEDLQGGCITVSNLGSVGIDSFIPIVIPGQCSILGVGQITETLLPEPKEPQVRKIVSLSLSVDHRVVNGAYGGQFLDYVRKILQDITNYS